MKNSIRGLFSLFVICSSSLMSCQSDVNNENNEGITYLHVLNAEDYIDYSVIDQFEEQNPNVKIIYETFDTNETMYNQLKTGKAEYDLICCSEYMIQRLASEKLIQKIEGLSTYNTNVSSFLVNGEDGKIDQIEVKDKKTNDVIGSLSEYAIGYMWGTLGIVYNPYYDTFVERNLTKDYLEETLNSDDGWSAFWNPSFKGVQSIKDSMRDTYALGILEVYKEDFLNKNLTQEEKNVIFNNHSDEAIDNVKDKLIELKSNIFGFEVDSGKNDIVTGKIGMNLAWSGDACFSILKGQFNPGEDESYEEEKEDPTLLYYALPSSGANIWFDAWCMPSTVDKNSANYEYSLKFLDFLSEPETVITNMIYTGYTSFMSGENNEIFHDYLVDSFDLGEDGDIAYDISYFFNEKEEGEKFILNVDKDSYEGRTLKAQYPTIEEIDHLYIMEDFGDDNNKIVQMREDVKVNPLPVFVVVLLVLFLAFVLGYLATYKLVKKYKIKKRKELRKSNVN